MHEIEGTGIGLRGTHVPRLLKERPDIPWLEALADNHLAGAARAQLQVLSEYYPVTLHCLGMSVGGTDPLDFEYLDQIRDLADETGAEWISDHLCWTAIEGEHLHDLMPLPYNRSVLNHVCERIVCIQYYLKRSLVIENTSSYFLYSESDMREPEFINELSRKTDCNLLLDLNNVYVACKNNGFSARNYVKALHLDNVVEIHLAGYEDKQNYLLDAHNGCVAEPVWQLYEYLLALRPDIPALFEWDRDIPALEVLIDEAHEADGLRRQCLLNRT